MCGCQNDYEKRQGIYYQEHYGAYRAKDCITVHLDAMSDSDAVQNWDATLYQEVATECDKLFLSGGNLAARIE